MLTYILTIVLLFMTLYSVIFVRQIAVRTLLIIFYACGLFFVWQPQDTNVIANWLGIGRGLDLFIVVFAIAVINGMVFLVRHCYQQHRQISLLARHIAIQDAHAPDSRNDHASE